MMNQLGATGGEAVEALLGGDQGMAGEGFVNLGTDPTLKKWGESVCSLF